MMNTPPKTLTHVAGTLLIEARAAFLNGAGLGSGENRNVTIHKTFREGRNSVPYVSAQAWRRWLRRTLIEETGWPSSEIRAIAWSDKGTTSKVGGQTDPVGFAEDDLFGYMRAAAGQGSREARDEEAPDAEAVEDDAAEESDTIAAVMRPSPLSTSVLASIRADGWHGMDKGFVHVQAHDPGALEVAEWLRAIVQSGATSEDKKKLKQDLKGKSIPDQLKRVQEFAKKHSIEKSEIPNPHSPLPYNTQFFNTDLEGVILLDRSRVGVFRNIGDRKELDRNQLKAWKTENKVTLKEALKGQGEIYELTNKETANQRCQELIKAIAVLRGGAKQAAFATDVAPKALVLAGLTCGNPIFNRLFEESDAGVVMNVERLREIQSDYKDRLTTPVFVGIRKGYLANEEKVRELMLMPTPGEPPFVVCTPIEAAGNMAAAIT